MFDDLLNGRRAIEEELRESDIPTFIVWGDNDRILHRSGAERLSAALNNASVKIMPNMGHVPMLERPSETAQHYLEFHGVTSAQ